MKYLDKSFSVSLSISQEEWDRIFKGTPTTTEPPPAEAAPPPETPAEDYSQRQCAACLERGQMEETAPGLLQCGICLARFPIGFEQAQKITGDGACANCGGTGRLRTSFTLFACGACGGTGARQP